jgi:DNA-binding transcriptional ArsR family regulator
MAGPKDSGRSRGGESHYRCAALLHPLRHRILRLMSAGEEAGPGEIAAELDEAPARIAYHLRLLVGRNALKVVPKRRPAAAHYRLAPDAEWVRKMLGEVDELGSEGG